MICSWKRSGLPYLKSAGLTREQGGKRHVMPERPGASFNGQQKHPDREGERQ
jgi:hypothetical protein